jgi:hypothetical protein
MLGVALVAASVGLNEAYTNAAGIPAAQGTAKRHLAVHEFSLKHPDALFLGDIDTSAIIVTQRLLIPRLLPETSALAPIVAGELASGRSVYVVDRPGSLVSNPLYSGYIDTLASSGLALCRQSEEGPFAEVVPVQGEGSRLVARLSVRANDPAGVVTPVLRQGSSYYLVASGEFAYNAAGARSDAVDLWLDDTRMASQRSAAHVYCRKVQGGGAPVRLYIGDASTQDNSGAITVSLWLAR